MAHHKRRRRKSARAGCTCGGKLYKHNGFKGTKDAVLPRDRRAIAAAEPVEGHTPPAKPKPKAKPRRGRTKGPKRRFLIEYRTAPDAYEAYEDGAGRWPFGPGPDWVRYSSYRRARDRDEALRCLQARVENGEDRALWADCEYRAVDR